MILFYDPEGGIAIIKIITLAANKNNGQAGRPQVQLRQLRVGFPPRSRGGPEEEGLQHADIQPSQILQEEAIAILARFRGAQLIASEEQSSRTQR